MFITIKQGTDVPIEITTTDGTNPVILTGGSAVFAYKKGDTVVEKDCTIVSNVIKTNFTADETSTMSGDYTFEVKAIDGDGDIGEVLNGRIKMVNSIIPIYGLED